MSAADGNCPVTCGATPYMISQFGQMDDGTAMWDIWRFKVWCYNWANTKNHLQQSPHLSQSQVGFFIPALAQGVISQRARVSSSVTTPICDRFSLPHVPQGHRRIDRLPPIILIGGVAGRNIKYGPVQPIGSTSATVWGTNRAQIYWFSKAVRLKLFICTIQ